MIIRSAIGVFIIFWATIGLAENPCNVMVPRGGDEDWGIGCYVIPDEFRIEVYDDTDGSVFGVLFTEYSQIYLLDKNKNKLNIAYEDIDYIGSYQNEIVKIKECFNPVFARVLWKTTSKILYVDKHNLEATGAVYKKYIDILFDDEIRKKYVNNEFNVGVNIEKSCLNLRKFPSSNATVITCIKGNDWEKDFGSGMRILDVKGNWAEIEYFEMHPTNSSEENDEDCSYIEKNRKLGWVKAIGSDGFPNVWFSVSSY